jgi:WD40 repeat protein
MVRVLDPRAAGMSSAVVAATGQHMGLTAGMAPDGVVMRLKLSGHTAWVSSVAWSPAEAHVLASAGYDHTVRIWDLRATSALFTIAAHTDKVLCLDWAAQYILSGGADRQLRIFRPPTSAPASA